MKNNSIGTKLLLAAITLAILMYFGIQGIRYFHDPVITTPAYTYQVESGITVPGYVARREQVLPDEGNSLLRLQRTEGERVSAGGEVARVYADQASLDRQAEMDALQTRLEQLQYAQEAALGSEVSLRIDAQIMQNLLDYRSDLAADNLAAAEAHASNLRSLVLKRDYTYANTEDLSGQIEQLQSQLRSLRSQAAGSTRRITAPAAGLYSAMVDGYETVLTPENVRLLTPSQFSDLEADPSVKSTVGKLILGDDWYYAAVVTAEQAEQIRKQGSLVLRFAKNVERDLPITVDTISEEENGRVVVVFRGRSYLSQITLLRAQSAQVIWDSHTGIRVPKEGLRVIKKTVVDEDGTELEEQVTGLYCMVGVEAVFKPVEILYSGEDFVLVQAAGKTEKSRLRPGDEVIITASDLHEGKIVE